MKKSVLFALFSAAYVLPLEPPSPERALINDNRKPAGTWPNTERLSYNMRDTIRRRVLNMSSDPHPMHLHGTYYSVESLGDATRDSTIAAVAHRK